MTLLNIIQYVIIYHLDMEYWEHEGLNRNRVESKVAALVNKARYTEKVLSFYFFAFLVFVMLYF